MDRHLFQLRSIGEEGHELRGFVFAVVGGEGGFGFLGEDGDAFGAAATVADGEVDFDALRL